MMELRELKPIMILKYVQTRFREAQNAGGSLGFNRPRHLVSASANQELRLSLKSGRRMGGMDTAGQPEPQPGASAPVCHLPLSQCEVVTKADHKIRSQLERICNTKLSGTRLKIFLSAERGEKKRKSGWRGH